MSYLRVPIIRWDETTKKEIRNSRINVTGKVTSIIGSLEDSQRPKVFVSSSAVGYYGISQDKVFTEKDSPGADFLSKVILQNKPINATLKYTHIHFLVNKIY